MKVEIFGCLFIMIIGILIGGFCWPYAINTWLVHCGKTYHVAFWQGALIGFIPGVGHFGIIAAFLSWLIMLFL